MLKIITLPYLSDFDKILYTTAYLELDDSHVTKYDFFLIQDGRQLIAHSVTVCVRKQFHKISVMGRYRRFT